jgi:integrative and conjugative element protein (TIGR02256 family)
MLPVNTSSQAWISATVVETLWQQAAASYPLETGGLLIGYFANDDVVITDGIGAGPKAIHRRYSFVPDTEFQERELARLYNASGRLHTYLGDWHTHPEGAPALSLRDRRTLARIGRHSEARLPRPLMLVFAGGPYTWEHTLVRLTQGLAWWGRKNLQEISVRTYEEGVPAQDSSVS